MRRAERTRRSGILLHPTSLPGESGIGDFGPWAYRFADFLAEGGMQLWQILPLGPPGAGHSPYQAYSSIACNPLLLSLETLAERGWLPPDSLRAAETYPESAVDFERVIPRKLGLVARAAEAFRHSPSDPLRGEFLQFCDRHRFWLDPFARFAALRALNGNAAWTGWTVGAPASEQDILDQKFIQFELFREWGLLRRYCAGRGIALVGDLPIFVAHDSADVWANPELFDLDGRGLPRAVAGVPPDYFSETGQCWGNPLYRWDEMERTGYRWWVERLRVLLEQVDVIRIDHFRGFEKYWEIPAGSPTAAGGRWVAGPGSRFFEAMERALGPLPFIAEDLGYITPEVEALRDAWRFPGMRVLQFAFGDEAADNPHKPFNFARNSVAYTGTHDNDTTAGWFEGMDRPGAAVEIERALRYMGVGAEGAAWGLVRTLFASVADTVVIPMQDALCLGSGARMNTPATVGGNWGWRLRGDQMTPELAERLRALNRIYGRLPEGPAGGQA